MVDKTKTSIPKKPSKWRFHRKVVLGISKLDAKEMAYPRRIFRIRKKHGRPV